PSSVAEAPRGAEPIFTDDFESATTAAWTETIDPVYVRFVEPMPGSALDDPSPPLVLQLWSPPGVPIDLSSLVVLHHVAPGQVDELALGCSFEPPVAVCSSDANFADGAVELEASVADGLGQVAAPTRVRFTVDTAPPTLAVAAPPDGLVTRAPGVTLEGMVSDGAAAPASVRLALDGVEVPVTPDGTWSALRTLEEGLNAFALVATDAAGNTTLAGHSVVRDTTAPGPVDVGRLTIEADAGALVITGAAGAAEAGARVRILHQDTGAVVLVTAAADGSFTASLAGAAGDVLVFEQLDAADNLSPPAPLAGPWSLPPDPATLAPPHDPTVVWDPVASLDFLYHGPQALQTLPDGSPLEPSTIEPWRISWLRGRVTDRSGAPLGGAVVRVLGYPELGVTRTRLDGAFDLVVNGGGLAVPLVVDVTRAGFLGVQRPVHAPWRGVVWVNDLVLVPLDPLATPIEMGSPVAQLAESTPQTDASGTRRATLLFPRGTTATRTLPDGTVEPLAALTVRASEYTVGPRGPLAMPGPLPPAVAYTYAVELSVDEARAVGATRVDFDRPVSLYVDNFLDFPVGAVAPVGWYDRAAGVWQAAPNGVVLRLVGVIAEGNPAEGLAAIDLDGDGIGEPSSVLEAEYGLDAIERRAMAERFRVGKSLWRVRVDHFTPWDVNWPYVPPDDAEPPPEPPPPEPPPPPPDPDTPPEDPAGVGDDGDDGDEPG
ncbi:MAG: Ig-like domain-containing protein, partial [Acidobacteriota bacterium]